jgi:cell division protein FtsW
MISRSARGMLSEWWWTVDRVAVLIMLALFGIGLLLAVAASPAVSGGPHSGGNFYYAVKQVAFAGSAVALLIGVSLLSPAKVGHVALAVFVLALLGTIAARIFGAETFGARRWLDFAGITVQPSEFLKPGFAVLTAVILSVSALPENLRRTATLFLLLPVLGALISQPDIGQTFLILALWAAMMFFAGLSFKWFWLIGGGAAGLGVLLYSTVGYMQRRIDAFLDAKEGTYQAGLSLKAFAHGGFAGVGAGAGTVKYRLPFAHSDYIFSVAGEEFGFLLCIAIVVLFCALAVRVMLRSASSRDPFVQLAGAGLAISVALQAFINMGVAVNLLPAKGMTLPFVSYGGSSLFAVALTMGFALALTRQRPKFADYAPPFAFMQGARP